MPTIVGVRLRNAAKPALFDTGTTDPIAIDDTVVVTTERGTEIGRVASAPRELAEGEHIDRANRVQRVATASDMDTVEELHRKEREAMPLYRQLVNKHKLDMKPTDVEYVFDGSKIVFYFVAEERVDFRDLVRDLAAEFHARVDMRQIGVRDEARMIGGLGHCGEQLCCMRFGGEFQPVSIRMAKEQDLPLNPLKISGLCGRLMCCLRYEYEAYKDFKGRAPKKGAIIEVGDQKGKVVEFNTPKETVTMRLEQGGSITVGLADLECGCDGTCPCKVRAEALEKPEPAFVATIAESATVLRAAESMPAQEGDASQGERTGRRRRRGAGSAEGAAPAATQTPPAGAQQPASRGGRRGGRGQQSGATQQPGSGQPASSRGGQQPPRTPKPAAEGQQPTAQGEAGAAPGRRRRRRRSGGGGAPSE